MKYTRKNLMNALHYTCMAIYPKTDSGIDPDIDFPDSYFLKLIKRTYKEARIRNDIDSEYIDILKRANADIYNEEGGFNFEDGLWEFSLGIGSDPDDMLEIMFPEGFDPDIDGDIYTK